MSSVAIAYGLKTLRITTTPAMSTAELLDRASKHFRVTGMGLFHKSKEVPNLPLRLLGLPQGAKLELRPSAKTPSEIHFKVMFINVERPAAVRKLMSSVTLQELMNDIGGVDAAHLIFQTMTKKVGAEGLPLTLDEMGVENNGVLRVIYSPPVNDTEVTASKKASVKPKVETKSEPKLHPNAQPNAQPKPQPKEEIVQQPATKEVRLSPEEEAYKNILVQQIKSHFAQQQEQDSIMDVDTSPPPVIESPPKEIPKHVYVFNPPSEPLPMDEHEESTYEVSVSQARAYQNMLSKYAHPTKKSQPLHHKIVNVEIRIRFPDQSVLQTNFKPDELNSDLYTMVRSALVLDEPFDLVNPHPLITIKDNDEKLTKLFDSRTLLLFKSSKTTGPFLKDEFLSKAKDITQADEMDIDTQPVEKPDDGKIHNGVLPKKTHNTTSASSDGKKVPKWLKLGKK